ncbi:MAG: hypothetical protein CM1200mP1_15230 [Candidatus Neomarinimicrobiota bacterium]|nr:MAG: hypothetical protein CM1200mP1_15230 [Candidatus Neomarinimicrobiota bacterium]
MGAGINFIDTAKHMLKVNPNVLLVKHSKIMDIGERVLIATKVHYRVGEGPNDEGNTRLHIIKACEDSLKRLQTDYIDLYQLHSPFI